MKYGHSLLLAGLVGLAACSIHKGLTPIAPKVGHYSPVVVDSLYPTFSWQPSPEPETHYDLAIFEILDSGQAGNPVYFREGLKIAEHKIEETLKPNTNYYWSIRPRWGTKIGSWASYDHKLLVPIPFGFYYQGSGSLFFPFKTPDN